jgi:hypothetical protein
MGLAGVAGRVSGRRKMLGERLNLSIAGEQLVEPDRWTGTRAQAAC